jgi:hypothetical protein
MIDNSTPGNRHFWWRKAAYLLGGYVAGGILTVDEARVALAVAVQRNTNDFTHAMHTIADCLAAGMQAAISLDELQRQRRQWLATHWHRHARVGTGQLQTMPVEEIAPWH